MWYYVRHEIKEGPFETEAIREMLQNGFLDPSTLVWREGMDDWVELRLADLHDDTNGETAPTSSPAFGDPAGEDRTLAIMAHVLGIIGGFLGPTILFAVAKDEITKEHAREALNWQISVLIYIFISFFLTFVLIGFFTMMAVAIMNMVVCIMGAIEASKGRLFRYPMTIRLVR